MARQLTCENYDLLKQRKKMKESERVFIQPSTQTHRPHPSFSLWVVLMMIYFCTAEDTRGTLSLYTCNAFLLMHRCMHIQSRLSVICLACCLLLQPEDSLTTAGQIVHPFQTCLSSCLWEEVKKWQHRKLKTGERGEKINPHKPVKSKRGESHQFRKWYPWSSAVFS